MVDTQVHPVAVHAQPAQQLDIRHVHRADIGGLESRHGDMGGHVLVFLRDGVGAGHPHGLAQLPQGEAEGEAGSQGISIGKLVGQN